MKWKKKLKKNGDFSHFLSFGLNSHQNLKGQTSVKEDCSKEEEKHVDINYTFSSVDKNSEFSAKDNIAYQVFFPFFEA